ncbi:U3 small nucleolar RNA-associated protein MPP10 [Nakaseomyces bracarensis]|uniref:U3 small nucleolar ribonucleoprotein protein MPP10 n=1 Tax=Nakaseomyces bracarensis TaxID=273131 RepID=A0ABR4P0R0_9SACH
MFVDRLQEDPVKLVEIQSDEPLVYVKEQVDAVIRLAKENGIKDKFDLDQLTVEGLDANQVWWQAKIVLDNIEGELMERIQELRELMNAAEPSSEDEEDDTKRQEMSSEVSSEESESEEVEEDDEEQLEEPVQDELLSGEEKSNEELEEEEEEVEDQDGQEDEAHITTHDQNETETPKDKSGVNDEFFNIDEFNKQTNDEDDPFGPNDEDEDIDYFGDIPSEEEEEAIYYNDFFDKPNDKVSKKNKNVHFSKDDDENEEEEEEGSINEDEEYYDQAMNSAKLDLFAEEDEDEEENEKESTLSTYQKKQQEIQKQIEQLEKEAVAEKKWTLKGEVRAKDRPEDTLLAEDLEFDRTAKPVPIITQEVTESLEEMIRRRIKEYNFDDLQRRTVADLNLGMRKERFELSDQKSSKSLAEIYEDDYKGNTEETEASEELQREHDEISDMFTNLFYKLDALSSAHFVPRPAKKALEVKVETAAISMEDAQPLSMSSASTLAPQEIYSVGKAENSNEIRLKDGTVMSKEELSREDKNRLRRAFKRKRSKALAEQAKQPKKKSKQSEVIDTLAKARNITVIDNKGSKRDVSGKEVKKQQSQQADFIKL